MDSDTLSRITYAYCSWYLQQVSIARASLLSCAGSLTSLRDQSYDMYLCIIVADVVFMNFCLSKTPN